MRVVYERDSSCIVGSTTKFYTEGIKKNNWKGSGFLTTNIIDNACYAEWWHRHMHENDDPPIGNRYQNFFGVKLSARDLIFSNEMDDISDIDDDKDDLIYCYYYGYNDNN